MKDITLLIRHKFIWIFIIILFIGELFLYAWSRLNCIRLGYIIAKEKGQQERLLLVKNNLTIELERLKAPKRIAEIAKKNLGLNVPENRQIIIINK
ncbi:MAG: cell division protein FtsL [Desulfobacterales bacterium]|nr:cell division protein FtsL [Desulfobacterales bacterium]